MTKLTESKSFLPMPSKNYATATLWINDINGEPQVLPTIPEIVNDDMPTSVVMMQIGMPKLRITMVMHRSDFSKMLAQPNGACEPIDITIALEERNT